jgi:hypothetical protein
MGASKELQRVGMAALATMTDAEILADPVLAAKVAMDAMRAVVNARANPERVRDGR